MANPRIALKNLVGEVSNRFEEACALGGVTEKEAVLGILLKLSMICSTQDIKDALMQAANIVEDTQE